MSPSRRRSMVTTLGSLRQEAPSSLGASASGNDGIALLPSFGVVRGVFCIGQSVLSARKLVRSIRRLHYVWRAGDGYKGFPRLPTDVARFALHRGLPS